MADPTLRVRQTLDNSQFKKGLKDSGSTVKSFGKIMAGAFSVAVIGSYFKTSLEGLQAEEKAQAQLLNSLKGRVDVTNRLISQAKELSQTTLFEDDAIIKGQSILAVFVKQESALKSLMPLVLDFATKFGMDIPEAAKLIGKSIGGSAVAMKKLGIEVEGANGTAERFNSVMEALNEKVGGAAAAAAATNAGSVQQLGKAWGEFGETLVSFIGPALSATARGLTQVTSAADTFLSSKNFTAWEKIRMILAGMVGNTNTVAKIVGNNYTPVVEEAATATESVTTEWEDTEVAVEKVVEKVKALKRLTALTYDTSGKVGSVQFGGQSVDVYNKGGSYQLASEAQDQALQGTDRAYQSLSGFTDAYATMGEKISMISFDMAQNIGGAFDAITDAFSNAIADIVTGQKSLGDALRDIANQLISIAIKMITTYLAQVIAAAFAGGASVGGPAAALTGAASAAGAAASFAGMIPALTYLAKGGIAYGPQMAMVGEYPGARTNPEVIAPLNKLESMMGGGAMELTGKFVIQGKDLVYIINQENSKLDRYR